MHKRHARFLPGGQDEFKQHIRRGAVLQGGFAAQYPAAADACFPGTYDKGDNLMNQMMLDLTQGMGRSLLIFILTLIFSLPLGLLVSFGRMSKIAPLRWLVKIYISVMRGTPLMLQLMVVYFGPFFIFGIQISNDYRFYAVLIGFAINYAAYFAEIYRGGIESMPAGQYEAAQILGYTKVQTFMRIILPQVIKRILPSLANEIITLVKDTSLAFAISYTEMFFEAKAWASKESNMFPYLIAAVFYYIFNMAVAIILERIEKSQSYYK